MNFAAFQKRVRENPRPLVVDLWAPWCAPCRRMTPILEKVAGQYRGQVDVWKINADESPDVLRELNVMGIPTLLVYKDGQKVMQKTGAQGEAALAALFQSALTGQPVQRGVSRTDRVLRLAAGGALAAYGLLMPDAVYLLIPAGVILFSAVYDRCPIYAAIAPRVKAWARQAISRLG